jgi:hypothetical protein
MERELPIRITIFRTLEGVALAVQRGKTELLKPSRTDGDTVSFDFAVRAAERKGGGEPNILGPYAFGTPNDRFFYVGAGAGAGQRGTPWTRRAKIKTKGITWKLVEQTLSTPGAVLEAQIDGRAKDGGPSCATVPLLDGGWKVRTR